MFVRILLCIGIFKFVFSVLFNVSKEPKKLNTFRAGIFYFSSNSDSSIVRNLVARCYGVFSYSNQKMKYIYIVCTNRGKLYLFSKKFRTIHNKFGSTHENKFSEVPILTLLTIVVSKCFNGVYRQYSINS